MDVIYKELNMKYYKSFQSRGVHQYGQLFQFPHSCHAYHLLLQAPPLWPFNTKGNSSPQGASSLMHMIISIMANYSISRCQQLYIYKFFISWSRVPSSSLELMLPVHLLPCPWVLSPAKENGYTNFEPALHMAIAYWFTKLQNKYNKGFTFSDVSMIASIPIQ